MVKLIVPKQIFRKMEDHALSCYPNEGCGVMIGEIGPDFGKDSSELDIVEFRPMPNAWDGQERTHRYQIDPDLIARLEKEFFGTGRGIIGLYHSHPDEPAWPTPCDLDFAWPHYAYLILSIKRGWLVEARAWRLSERTNHISDGRAFEEIALKQVTDNILTKLKQKRKEDDHHESRNTVARHAAPLRQSSGSRRR